VIVTDARGEIAVWSDGAERVYGWAREDVLGRSAFEVLVPADLQDAGKAIMGGLAEASSTGWRGSFRVKRKDGSEVDVYTENTPVIVAGEVVAIVGESVFLPPVVPPGPEPAVEEHTSTSDDNIGPNAAWFATVTEAASSAVSVRELDDLVHDVLATVVSSFNANAASLLFADRDGHALVARFAHGWDAEIARPMRLPIGTGVSGRVLASMRPLVVDDLDDVDVFSPELRRSGFHSYVGVPLVSHGRCVGVLHATSFERSKFTATDAEALSALARALAPAVHRVGVFVELANLANPTVLPAIEGLEVHARYEAADGGAGGGDWYDVVRRDDGSVAVVIGDAAGHGIDAMVSAGAARHTLLAYLHEGHSPAEALLRLQRLASTPRIGPSADFLTVLAGVYEPSCGLFHVASAGHPPVLHIAAGTAQYGAGARPAPDRAPRRPLQPVIAGPRAGRHHGPVHRRGRGGSVRAPRCWPRPAPGCCPRTRSPAARSARGRAARLDCPCREPR
jgi:PAS domain S-box-containing protein